MKGSDINTNKRLFDLVRFARASLHNAGLITDEEYTWLCAAAPFANSTERGSPSARRLEDYDQLRQRLANSESALASAKEELQGLKATVEQTRDALRANLVFHTPLALRRRGGTWDEYEIDAINRTRDAIGSV